jgi:CheY-like chemotaxis protein
MSKLSAVAGAAMSKLSTAPEERARILIVDDEPAALLTLQAVLEEFHDVEAVANAVQAEAVLAKSNIQILLTDYEMPGRSGMDLINLVFEKYPHIVPILLTGHTAKREVRLADKDRNIFAVLSKPYEPAELLRSLRLAAVTANLRNLRALPYNASPGKSGMKLSPPSLERPNQRVLLVEDDTSNAATLAALLEDAGCIVDTAASLATARNQLLQSRYAVVLLDYNLGDGKSTELLPLLQSPPIPTVLLSGSAEPPIQRHVFAARFQKGADPEELLRTVRRLIELGPLS